MLRFLGEVRQNGGVIGQIVQHPGRRCAGRSAELHRDVESHFVIVLVTAPAFGLQHMNEPGLDIFVDRLLRNFPITLGFDGALAQFWREFFGAPNQFIGARHVLLWRLGGAQFRDTHGVSSV